MKRSESSRRLSFVEELETRSLLTMATIAQLPNLSATAGASVAPINLDTYFKDSTPSADFAIFNTTLGTIPVLLTPQTTPVTVANFKSYVGKGDYVNTIVHRSVPGFVWQTGGYQLTSTPNITPITTDAPIKNEFGASNVRGTIAMAKAGNDPNSATSQFFFNESNDNAANLDNQNGGFTVFGRVVGTAGLAVMDAVANVPEPSPSPLASPFDQIPLQGYTAGKSVQPSNLILVNNVTLASALYLASSNAPTVATGSIQDGTLTINSISAGTAQITVLGYGSDGQAATETFTVEVAQSAGSSTVPPSSLTPTVTGLLPASVVTGQKIKIQQTVSLTASAGAIAQKEHLQLTLSKTTTGSPADNVIANATTMVRLKAGKQVKLKLSTTRLNAATPAGTYHVLVTVTDPDGSKTTVDTGKILSVKVPQRKAFKM